ncbi:MAG: FAD-binding protein, partial [Candidatus Acidiferrales bacterium]
MEKDTQIATVKILEGVALERHSNYRIGGPARYFCDATNEEDIRGAVLFAREQKLPLFILGGGTNLLISDKGFEGVILKPSLMQLVAQGETVTVGTGVM